MIKGVFSIARGVPFLASLAHGLLRETQPPSSRGFGEPSNDPMALAQMRILLPNRRSVRALREVFLAATNGRATLLPRMIALGDVDGDGDMQMASLTAGAVVDIPPPLSATERLLQLSRMVQLKDESISAAQAIALARELATLLDELYIYNVDVSNLATLPHERYAEHWQQTLRFLDVITTVWPQHLKRIGRSDPTAYRLKCLKVLSDAWRAVPPPYPVIMAGIARAEPTIMELAKTVGEFGAVIVPAFDRMLPAENWLRLDVVHPDALLRDVIDGLGVTREQVQAWPVEADGVEERVRWLSLALQPAALTANWQMEAVRQLSATATDNIDYIPCIDESTEAQTVALLMRGALEEPEKTVMLVTPDRALARRVAALLKRWGINADDSGGQPLLLAPLGVYLQLVVAAASPQAGVHDMLALLKHPLCGLGMEPAAKAQTLAALEVHAVRGSYPAAGVSGFCAHVIAAVNNDAVQRVAKQLLAGLAPFATSVAAGAPAKVMLHAHLLAAEVLAATHSDTGEERLWIGPAAEIASAELQAIGAALGDGFVVPGGDYAPWLAQMLAGCAVRVPYGLHPRVIISGLIESRLQQADVMVLAGLNEGVWPALPPANPWLNRDMRRTLGMPDTEEHITQQAHDFISGASAHKVYLTRALRSGGVPMVPARWLQRLQATLVPLGLAEPWLGRGASIAQWAEKLDAPEKAAPLAKAPAPQPQVSVRPRSLSVTNVEQLMRDPYGFYARHVLRLRPLDDLADTPSAAERGRYVHDVLATFLREVSGRVLASADWERLQQIGIDCLQPYAHVPGIAELWGTWMQEVSAWFWDEEKKQRPQRLPQVLEGEGVRRFEDMEFTLKARADRIDTQPDALVVVDYKTGAPPSQKDMGNGLAPQLALEALIAASDGFNIGVTRPVISAEYWHIAGTLEKCKRVTRTFDLAATADGLRALVQTYLLSDAPFTALPRGPREYNDYRHLARTAEWAFAADDGDDPSSPSGYDVAGAA